MTFLLQRKYYFLYKYALISNYFFKVQKSPGCKIHDKSCSSASIGEKFNEDVIKSIKPASVNKPIKKRMPVLTFLSQH